MRVGVGSGRAGKRKKDNFRWVGGSKISMNFCEAKYFD
jgi:hypothetical protein